jgi:hypothetical protein
MADNQSTTERKSVRRSGRARAGRVASLFLTLAIAGCSSIGPPTVSRDRTDYLTALATSWKEQTLSNVVHIRYADAPAFLYVSSIVSTYSLDTGLTAGLTLNSDATLPSNQYPLRAAVFGASVTYQDRPTISYTPLSGEQFTKRLIRPIPPVGIFELIQAGNPADVVLQLTVRSMNGIKNQRTLRGKLEPADPEFYAVVDAIRRLQVAGRLSVRTEKRGNDEVGILVLEEGRTAEANADVKFVRDTLRLKPAKHNELVITFGTNQRSDVELAVLSRSMGDIFIELAMGIDVPAEDVASGRTEATLRLSGATNPRERPLVRILSGASAPANAFASIRYRNRSYWIDDGDYLSKLSFTLLMIFTSLAETGVTPQIPTLTLPVR